MTVISTLITSRFTTHATDSFVTRRQADGTYKVVNARNPKVVRVPAFRGAISYWGLAGLEPNWNTLEWLRQQAGRAAQFASAELFATNLAEQLTREMRKFRFAEPRDSGIGLHFTTYERVSDYWVPEMFMVSNWTDPTYTRIHSNGFSVTRHVHATLQGKEDRPPEQREIKARLEVHEALHSGGFVWFNNGDPLMFNPIASTVREVVRELRNRGHLRAADVHTQLSLTRRPVEIVSALQKDFAREGMKLVGGKPHELAISPVGTYTSRTGD